MSCGAANDLSVNDQEWCLLDIIFFGPSQQAVLSPTPSFHFILVIYLSTKSAVNKDEEYVGKL